MSLEVSREPTNLMTPMLSSAIALSPIGFSPDLSDPTAIGIQTERSGRGLIAALRRRLKRERRRRKVGRAYDMALEIARLVPKGSEVLDVGCGNGFIAHHLSALLQRPVVGIDVTPTTEASIDYRPYDGVHFPMADKSVDAVLLCYVLHHAQDVQAVLNEVQRVLHDGGRVIVYEDMPQTWWDRGVCAIHNRQWRERTGPCIFRSPAQWQSLFRSQRFEIISERPLSRSRNLTHPVARRFFVLTHRRAG